MEPQMLAPPWKLLGSFSLSCEAKQIRKGKGLSLGLPRFEPASSFEKGDKYVIPITTRPPLSSNNDT